MKQSIKTIGQRLRHIRKVIYKETAEKFIKRLDISQPTLSAIETDKKKISQKVLVKLATMGINVNWVLIGKGKILVDALPEEELLEKGICPHCYNNIIRTFNTIKCSSCKQSWIMKIIPDNKGER